MQQVFLPDIQFLIFFCYFFANIQIPALLLSCSPQVSENILIIIFKYLILISEIFRFMMQFLLFFPFGESVFYTAKNCRQTAFYAKMNI